MIERFSRLLDSFTGRGEAAVTVPPLDGALRANRALDEAATRFAMPGVDCLASVDGRLYAAAGAALAEWDGAQRREVRRVDGGIACLAECAGGLAVALEDGRVMVETGPRAGAVFDTRLRCITAMAVSGNTLFPCNGSTEHAAGDWQKDLMERRATGEVWRIDLDGGKPERIAKGLGWPAGIVAEGSHLVVSEAWKHRLVRLDDATPVPVHSDLPGYPGRIVPAGDGYWLAVFAPRSQLVEFVLREPAYRRRMVAEVPRPYWIAPTLRAGRSFYEPLQGGSVKQLGMLKPWAPTLSSGFCVRLDARFQPVASLHSRADGVAHGVTSVVRHGGQVWAAAKGDGVVVAVEDRR